MLNDTIWMLATECVATEVDDALVLLDLDAGSYFALNAPAADIWRALAEPKTEAALLDVLLNKYQIDREHCTRSLATLLKHLEDKGLAKPAS